MRLTIQNNEWLTAPFAVRLFVLRFLCDKGLCGQAIHVGMCFELLKTYSYGYFNDYAFGDNESTQREHVLKVDDLVIAFDGEDLLSSAWYQTVTILKRQLIKPFIHEFHN